MHLDNYAVNLLCSTKGSTNNQHQNKTVCKWIAKLFHDLTTARHKGAF